MREAIAAWAAFALAPVVAIAAAKGAERRPMAVWSGTLPPPESVKGNNCNVAVVSGLRRERRLLVRSGPGPGYAVVAALRAGKTVFTCNGARRRSENGGRDWIGIAFAGPGKPCTGATAEGLDIRRSVHCRTGWVGAEWVTVISG